MKKTINRAVIFVALCIGITPDVSYGKATSQTRGGQSQKGRQPTRRAQRRSTRAKVAQQPQLPKIEQQIKTDTKNLEENLANVETAQTPQEKEQAQQDAIESAQELLKTLTEERSLLGDVLTGYSLDQITKARKKLRILYPFQERLNQQINFIQENKLDPITEKGFLWNAAKEGKEKEYALLTTRVNKLNETLKKVDRAIRNQKVIAGEEWSNAFRLLLVGGAALGVDFLVTGGAGTAMATSAVKTGGAYAVEKAGNLGSLLKEKGGIALDYIKAKLQWGAGTASTLLLLYNRYNQAHTMYTMALNAYKQIAADPVATPQARETEKKKMLDAQKERDRRKTALDSFREKLATGTITSEELNEIEQKMKQLKK